MTLTSSGIKLEQLIKKALEDGVVTFQEYEEIISAAHEDHVIDSHEQVLLREFKTMIANNLIRRVA